VKRASLSMLAALGLASGCTCQEELPRDGAEVPASAPPSADAPQVLYLPDAAFAPRVERAEAPAAPRCPLDMVDVDGAFCIDRYEAVLIDHDEERPLSPYYHPTRARTRSNYAEWAKLDPAEATWFGPSRLSAPRLPSPPPWQLSTTFEPRARNERGVIPQGYLSGEIARVACENAGKRLCLEEEWVHACRGEDDLDFPYGASYEAGACNVARGRHPAALLHGNASINHRDPRLNLVADGDGPLLRRTGDTPRCASPWGDDAIYDMVGNVDEWIDDDSGVFLGGFYSRKTEKGCAMRVGAHPPAYYDYSLGVRCCL
jgi:formylglycine-generating enzyme required for sulfatase activity